MSSSRQGNQRDKARRTGDVQDVEDKKPEPRTGPNPLVAGVRATSSAAMRGVRKASPPIARALALVARMVAIAVLRVGALLERVLRPVHRALGPLTSAALRPIGPAVNALERVATPRRALAATALIAAGCLIASQFLDSSGVAIGGDQYVSVSALTSPPLKGVETPFGPHGPAVIMLGIVGFTLLAASLMRSDRRFALIASLAGLLSVLITLAIDLPAAADVGVLATQFEGTDSVLLPGFYAQLSAAAILTLAGALLAIRTAAPIRQRRHRRESPPVVKAGTTPSGPGQVKQVGT